MLRQRTFQKIVPAWVIAGLVLCFFYRLAFTDLIIARGDSHAYFYPYWDARDAALQSGSLPLWTSDLFMGAPLLANPQIGTLYPPNWLTIPLYAPDAIRVSLLLHLAWATLGAYWLARRALRIDPLPALVAGVLFGLGGFLSAHAEQINQVQSLSWMPWLFLLLEVAMKHPRRGIPLLGAAWALQVLAGHPQIVFISGVGLGIYSLFYGVAQKTSYKAALRPVALLALAACVAVILALPQLLPTQQLITFSNRSGGFNPHEATAFSLNPLMVGRGLLPSYDGQPFTEYIGYLGIAGLGLAMAGLWSGDRRRWVWVLLMGIGLFFAFGRHNPLYLQLAHLPGFNLFRVPARWLALFTLGGAMLGGIGMQALRASTPPTVRHVSLVLVAVTGILAANAMFSNHAAEEIYGPQNPTLRTWAGWIAALGVFVILYLWNSRKAPQKRHAAQVGLCVLVIVELWAASHKLPYNDLVDPSVYRDARFTARQMQVYGEGQTPPGRLLAISDFLFFPGDEAVLNARWQDMGLRERAIETAFTAVKRQETITGNLPLTWGIPSIDGFGGGVLPTEYYTAFTSLFLPEGTLRTVDGRLREVLAQPECRGACLPKERWLDLTNTQYLLTDKVYDRNHEGIFYDTLFNITLTPWVSYRIHNPPPFEANSIHMLYKGDVLPRVRLGGADGARLVAHPVEGEEEPVIDGYRLARLITDDVITSSVIIMRLEADTTLDIRAISLVDTRTGDFVQVAPEHWKRIYSADVKIYQNLDVLSRAFVVHEALIVPDTWDGTERALELMRDMRFDPAVVAVINSDSREVVEYAIGRHPWFDPPSTTTITEHAPTRVTVEVEAGGPGYLVLTDAFYPEWHVTVNGAPAEIYRANVMFRAVQVPAGHSVVVFEYRNNSFRIGLILTALFVAGYALLTIFTWQRGHHRDPAC